MLDPLHCRQHRCQQQTYRKGGDSINEETDAHHAKASPVAGKKAVQARDNDSILVAEKQEKASRSATPNAIVSPTFKSSVLRIRLILGEQIALALALLVASDILDTVLKPSHAYEVLDVVKMGFVTILRTGLAYFLAREIKELEEEHKEDTHQHRMAIPHSENHHAESKHVNAIASDISLKHHNDNRNGDTQRVRNSPEAVSLRLQRAHSNSIRSLQSYSNHPGYCNSNSNASLSPRATMQYDLNSDRQGLRSTESAWEQSLGNNQYSQMRDNEHSEDRRRRRRSPRLASLDADMDDLRDEGEGNEKTGKERRGEEMYYYENPTVEDDYGHDASGQPSPYFDNACDYARVYQQHPMARLVRSQSSQNSGGSHRTYTYDIDAYEVDANGHGLSRSSSTQRPWSLPSTTRHDRGSQPFDYLGNETRGNSQPCYTRTSDWMNSMDQRAVNDHSSRRSQSQRQRNCSFDRNNSYDSHLTSNNNHASRHSPTPRSTVAATKISATDAEGEDNEDADEDRHLSPEDSKPSSALLSSNNNSKAGSKTNSQSGSSLDEKNSIREEENEDDDEAEDREVAYPVGLTQRRVAPQRAH